MCFGQSEVELRMLSTHQWYFDSSSLKNTHFKYVEHRSGVQALGSRSWISLITAGILHSSCGFFVEWTSHPSPRIFFRVK